MRQRVTFGDVIISFYEAATEPALWMPALASMTRLFSPAFIAHWFTWDRTKNVDFSIVDRDELAGANKQYVTYYAKIDPRTAMGARLPVGEVLACHHHFDEAYVAKSEFYQDFLIRIGGRYIATAKVDESDRCMTFVSVHRNTRQGPFEASDLELLKRLQPHLTQATRLFHKFHEMKVAQSRSVAAIDRVPWGILVVDRNTRILETNAAGEALLKRADVLRSEDGRLDTISPERTTTLRRLICDAFSAACGNACRPGGLMRIDRASGEGYVTILAVPLRQSTRAITKKAETCVVLFTSDSETRPILPIAWLSQLYGLTPAEATVALAIAAGKTLEEISAMNGVTKNTVRVQTQSVLEKTGTRRQAELVGLLSRIPSVH